MQGHGDQVAGVDVPRPGDDLDGGFFAHVQPAYPHMVGVGVALHGLDAARHHVGDLRAQVGGALHLRAGQGHGLGEILIVYIYLNKFIEPFSG